MESKGLVFCSGALLGAAAGAAAAYAVVSWASAPAATVQSAEGAPSSSGRGAAAGGATTLAAPAPLPPPAAAGSRSLADFDQDDILSEQLTRNVQVWGLEAGCAASAARDCASTHGELQRCAGCRSAPNTQRMRGPRSHAAHAVLRPGGAEVHRQVVRGRRRPGGEKRVARTTATCLPFAAPPSHGCAQPPAPQPPAHPSRAVTPPPYLTHLPGRRQPRGAHAAALGRRPAAAGGL